MANIRILANDGIHPAGKEMLENAGYEVVTDTIAQEDLPQQLPDFDVILVRSATKVRKDLIDGCPNLKIIGRGGVGLDNIDVDYAKERDIAVYNTPAASSQSVAELVFAHAIGAARFLQQSNRKMPLNGVSEFKTLKKAYSAGVELRGKTIGIVGFGRIGQAVGRIAVGLGMKVLAHDPYLEEAILKLEFQGSSDHIQVQVKTISLKSVLEGSDIVTLHVPSQGRPVIGEKELKCMKPEAILINASRGGIIHEEALIEALDTGEIAAAGLDVFANEPTPSEALLGHPKISLSPHIGAATGQAQANIGTELAGKIIQFFGQ